MMKTKAQIGQAKDADSKVSSFTSSAISDLDSDMILFTQLPQELYKYTWPTITGFSFTAKAWEQVCVTSFEDIKFNTFLFCKSSASKLEIYCCVIKHLHIAVKKNRQLIYHVLD